VTNIIKDKIMAQKGEKKVINLQQTRMKEKIMKIFKLFEIFSVIVILCLIFVFIKRGMTCINCSYVGEGTVAVEVVPGGLKTID
jgi:hypothetical protein